MSSENTFRPLVLHIEESMEQPDVAFLLEDGGGRILYASKSGAGLFGYTTHDLARRSFAALAHPGDRKMVRAYRRARLGGKAVPAKYVFRGLRKDGAERHIEALAIPVRIEGDIVGTGMYLWDITDRELAKDELSATLALLRDSMGTLIEVVSKIIETRDPYTAGHQRRVSDLARAIAREMGMPRDRIDIIRIAALIHDIGKISVPAEILSKPGALSAFEFEILKGHSRSGYEILKDINFTGPVADIVLQHHERYDGSGYPLGLKGDDILLEAKIIGIADVIEAICSHRPYRPALGIDRALEEISKKSGKLYDPKIVPYCVALFERKGYQFKSDGSGPEYAGPASGFTAGA
jgi:PAS domain S-box-containing protein/putative nucleotidyltransferase with HDIG domain